tara:strand:- start:776 stop:1666 length:891 start_codon:yes stop_codon:yes gene_type:complete
MNHRTIKNRLLIAAVFTFAIMIAEGIGGYLARSLALIGDAVHMFMDVVALILAWFAIVISERPSTITKSYGYHRVEVFAAFLNGSLLLVMSGGIFVESFRLFWNPREIEEMTVLLVALFGLITNLIVIYYFKDSAFNTTNLNVQSVFAHILGDSLASVGVIIGAIIIHFTGWYQLDALIGMAIGLLILWGTFRIISDSMHILLEGVPKGVSLIEVRQAIVDIPAVKNVHELHIWCICSNIYALSAHAIVSEYDTKSGGLLEEIRRTLRDRFNIDHSTIQLELVSCGKAEVFCDIKH